MTFDNAWFKLNVKLVNESAIIALLSYKGATQIYVRYYLTEASVGLVDYRFLVKLFVMFKEVSEGNYGICIWEFKIWKILIIVWGNLEF